MFRRYPFVWYLRKIRHIWKHSNWRSIDNQLVVAYYARGQFLVRQFIECGWQSGHICRLYSHFRQGNLGCLCRTTASEYQRLAVGRKFEHGKCLAQTKDVGIVTFQSRVVAVAGYLYDIHSTEFQHGRIKFVEERNNGFLVRRCYIQSDQIRISRNYVRHFRNFRNGEKCVLAVSQSQFRKLLGKIFLRKRMAQRTTYKSELSFVIWHGRYFFCFYGFV